MKRFRWSVLALAASLLLGAPTALGVGATQNEGAPDEEKATAPPVAPSHEMVFHRALRSLMTDEAPADVRLSEEQRRTIATIERERMEAFREFTRAHADRLRELRAEIAEKRRAGDEAAVGALMLELRDIEQARPNAEEYTKRVWDALTEPQRIHLRNAVDDAEFESLQRRVLRRLNSARAAETGDGAAAMSEEAFERVRAAVSAPTAPNERETPHAERMRARILALPDRVATRQQRETLAAELLRGEERGGRG